MREIKFRAWDEKEKCWVCGFAIHQNGMFSDWAGCKEVNGKCYADANWEQLKNIPHIKIMQYTGLKDKNGKEIYEGDILRCIFEDENYIVEWDEIGAGFLFHRINNKKRTGGIDYYEFEDICGSFGFEVIGNIFDHPHLLEEGVQE